MGDLPAQSTSTAGRGVAPGGTQRSLHIPHSRTASVHYKHDNTICFAQLRPQLASLPRSGETYTQDDTYSGHLEHHLCGPVKKDRFEEQDQRCSRGLRRGAPEEREDLKAKKGQAVQYTTTVSFS